MPIMDGFEATSKIKQYYLSQLNKSDPFIIGISAATFTKNLIS